MTNNDTAPLLRNCSADKRNRAARTPQVPVTLWVRHAGDAPLRKIHTLVGVGGWLGDYTQAAARELGMPAAEIRVETAQGGHV